MNCLSSSVGKRAVILKILIKSVHQKIEKFEKTPLRNFAKLCETLRYSA